MKLLYFYLYITLFFIKFNPLIADSDIVSFCKRIIIQDYKYAHNPSMIKLGDKILLTFRYCPLEKVAPWISYIGVVLLNEDFDVISSPLILNTRKNNLLNIPSQSEDARIFQYNKNIYLLYNDNTEQENPKYSDRRDMYLAELLINEDKISVGKTIKLFHKVYYKTIKWQKNWVPFEKDGRLLIIYSTSPYEIIEPDLSTGECKIVYKNNKNITNWQYGVIRGGTPALDFDGQYLSFFHSSYVHKSKFSMNRNIHHYYMGAIVFSINQPFNINKISEKPIYSKYFYTVSDDPKKVIFPGGFFVGKESIFIAYGKDDRQIWVCSINKDRLKNFMVDVSLK